MVQTPNKSQHTKLILEKKILPPPLPGFELATFRSRVRRLYQQAIRLHSAQKVPVTSVTSAGEHTLGIDRSDSPNVSSVSHTELAADELVWQKIRNVLSVLFYSRRFEKFRLVFTVDRFPHFDVFLNGVFLVVRNRRLMQLCKLREGTICATRGRVRWCSEAHSTVRLREISKLPSKNRENQIAGCKQS